VRLPGEPVQWPTIGPSTGDQSLQVPQSERARFAVLTSEDFGVGYELFQRLPTLPDELFEHSAHRSVRAADVRHRSVPAPLHSFVFAMSLVVATSRFGAVFSLYALMTSWYQSDMDGPRGHPRLPGGAILSWSFAPQPPGDVVAGTGTPQRPLGSGHDRNCSEGLDCGVRVRLIWVTSLVDGADHAVTDENMCAGMADRTGTYVAWCGARVVPPSMCEPSCGRCRRCVALLRIDCLGC